MTRTLQVVKASPGMSVQDLGRPGFLTFGLSKGGAADPLALAEGAALLGQEKGCAVLEMAAMGGVFVASEDVRIALTGAPMRAKINSETLAWNASHLLPAGAELQIGSAENGNYGYLSIGGGIETELKLSSRSAHLSVGVDTPIQDKAILPIGDDKGHRINQRLEPDARFSGGRVRVVPSLQTGLFDEMELKRFEETVFRRDVRSNRMGARLNFDTEGFSAASGLSILSEVIVPGDIQITGDGTPFVLMSECQTIGGYPRIGSVLPSDLARVAQAPAQSDLHFCFIDLDEAVAIEARAQKSRADLAKSVTDLVRDPHKMSDLLSYELISGVVDAQNTIENT